ncbi:MAG TPA: hypothetical protein VEH31_17515 [Streptosporangiaceae bacterium]|nr:hypothetical protein [Streptosporangiaceae bacterium]
MDGQNPRAHLTVTLITLAAVLVLAWLEMPEWQRQMTARAARLRLRRLAAAAARASGYQAMGNELAGNAPQAEAGYRVTERLSRLRDRLGFP